MAFGLSPLRAAPDKPPDAPPAPVLEWLPLSPPVYSESGAEAENSTRPVLAPRLNELVKAEQPGQYPVVASRIITICLPDPRFAGQEVEWKMIPLRGSRIGLRGVRGELPASCPPFQGVEPFAFQPSSQRSRVDADGVTAVRVNVPPAGLNRVRITAAPVNEPGTPRRLPEA